MGPFEKEKEGTGVASDVVKVWWQMELSYAPSTCASHRSLAQRIVA